MIGMRGTLVALSPSGLLERKLRGYFTVPSVQHYLIVAPEKQVVIHHARGEGDALQTRLLSAGEFRLDPAGIVLNVQEFYG